MNTVVSFLTGYEENDLGLAGEERLSQLNGINFISFPVPDRSIPADTSETIQLIRRLEEELAAGKTVALHCRQGIGRSAVIAAALLVSAGLEPEAAFERLRRDRGCAVPETVEQSDWVIKFGRELTPVQR